MKGQIAIPKIEVDQNQIGFTVYDFFKSEVRKFTNSILVGWYAMKLKDDIYYFKWCDHKDRPKREYLKALQENGWEIPYPINYEKLERYE